MAYADIPQAVLTKLASERVRMYHALWHFVRTRDSWEQLEPAQKQELVKDGWTPPRFEREPRAGIDFLYMHRRMISMVNNWAREAVAAGHHGHAHDDQPPFVIGWLDIPWDHKDAVWPMPEVDLTNPDLTPIFGRSKEPAVTDQYRQRCVERFNNRGWLRTSSLDAFGTELESSIHGWFHMHWSPVPPVNPNSLDVANDWLGSPFSSHANKHFWKLHGWIDDRINAWEDANGITADLSGGWDGPLDYVTGEMHSADPKFFGLLRFEKLPPLVMPWKDLLLEVLK